MINVEKIEIIEKPDNISYERIHDLLWRANESNRRDGFILRTSNLSGEQIEETIRKEGSEGHCFVALYNKKQVGTLSLLI